MAEETFSFTGQHNDNMYGTVRRIVQRQSDPISTGEIRYYEEEEKKKKRGQQLSLMSRAE
jgi:hypothetical protein